jgi:hypothetical protein
MSAFKSGRSSVNGDRHNGFGPRSTQTVANYTKSQALTREAAKLQPADKAFGVIQETEQRICGECKAPMLAHRSRCQFCGGGAR